MAPKKAPPPPPVEKRKFIWWDEDEWDQLAEFVWRARQKDPSTTLVSLAQKAMTRMPAERRRTINANAALKPLIERLGKIDAKYLHLTDDKVIGVNPLEQVATPEAPRIPTKDEIIATLSDEEIVERFTLTVLESSTPEILLNYVSLDRLIGAVPYLDLLAAVFKLTAQNVQRDFPSLLNELVRVGIAGAVNPRPPSTPARNGSETPHVAPPILPKIAVVGLLPDQQHALNGKLHARVRFVFVDKNRKPDEALPDRADAVVLAQNFVSHGHGEAAKAKFHGTTTRVMSVAGGVTAISKTIERWLAERALQSGLRH